MSKTLEVKGTVNKVTRENGKVEAVVQISIPANKSQEVPLGAVIITFEEAQQSLDLGKKPSELIRGNRG